MSKEAISYDEGHIQLLTGLEAVRKRPGMYIGSTGERGLHQLVFEVVGRAVSEATTVAVTLTSDGGVRVADDGPGLDFEELTEIRTGTGPRGRHVALVGLPTQGLLFTVTALSSRLRAEVRGDGVRQVRSYTHGVALDPASWSGPAAGSGTGARRGSWTGSGTGTTVDFWPDPDIFETTQFSFDTLAARLREVAFLNRELDLSLSDGQRTERFHFPGGARDFLAFLEDPTQASPLTDAIAFTQEDERMGGSMEIAFRWSDSGEGRVSGFANSLFTREGGTHLRGFRDGLAAALGTLSPGFDPDRMNAGLTAVVSVKLDDLALEGATRTRLCNVPVRQCVGQAVQEHLTAWLQAHPERAVALLAQLSRATPRG
ncbi:hypothetical protein [Streptacidiphilus jiangxiensis]|uniref:DNA topoisomerase (ATP-hydrolyzing) n=1 Tax=Streptacidiphilus jiangxiensis TaxID=235985 RepID=A0A1H7FR32_STRJI|nr:hypothetical protein [Streptacidiphilus jiangxiensis]SEK26942.1 DNA gyrase subunit B [Streptacidiphilus jiangxiensis]